MSRPRTVFAAVAVFAVSIVLAGCSPVPHAGSGAGTAAKTPTVGSCWNATQKHAASWSDWEGEPATACTGSHTLYTYQIGTIRGVSAQSWAAPGDPSNLSSTVQAKGDDACSISTLLPNLKWNQQLVSQYFFVPSEAQWKAGARWVRCDVGVIAVGTTLNNESFTALPAKIATLVARVSSDPKQYEFCLNSTESVSDTGPLDDPHATIAECSASPQWTLAAHGKLPEPAGAPFPTDAVANTESTAICAPSASGDGEVWVGYLPAKVDWASGDREVECWVGQKQLIGGQTA